MLMLSMGLFVVLLAEKRPKLLEDRIETGRPAMQSRVREFLAKLAEGG